MFTRVFGCFLNEGFKQNSKKNYGSKRYGNSIGRRSKAIDVHSRRTLGKLYRSGVIHYALLRRFRGAIESVACE